MKIVVLLCSLFFLGLSNLDGQSYKQMECEVWDGNKLLSNAFVGGLNAPQISTTDLNFDGKMDIVLFDKAGDIILPMINIGSENEAEYKFDINYVKYFPSVRGILQLKDFNKDGMEDLFTFGYYGSALDVYRAVRVGDHIEYKLMVFEADVFGLYYTMNGMDEEIYIGPPDLPGIVDVDGDGDLDILNYYIGGKTIYYYKNVSLEKGFGLDTLVFELEDNCWGLAKSSLNNTALILSEDGSSCADDFREETSESDYRHAGSANFCVFDNNGDGVMDLIIGDEASKNLIFLENGGTKEDAWIIAQDTTFPSYNIPFDMEKYCSSYFIDYDNDNRRDLLATTNTTAGSKNFDNIRFYKNIGSDNTPLFELQEEVISISNMLDFGGISNPCFVDENSDGLLDIVVGTYGLRNGGLEDYSKLVLLRNIGTSSSPKYKIENNDYMKAQEWAIEYSEQFAPTYGDLDGDGDLDMLVGDRDGRLYYFNNNAGANNTLVFDDPVYPYMDIKVGRNAKPKMVDINQDGLLDLVVGEKNNNTNSDGEAGSLNYFENQGSIATPFFDNDLGSAPNSLTLGGVDIRIEGGVSYPDASVDFVKSGDDLFLFTGNADGFINLYSDVLKDKDHFEEKSMKIWNLDVGNNATVAVADINNDGYYELLLGNRRGGLTLIHTPIHENGQINTKVVAERVLVDEVKLYPNPASDLFYVQVGDEQIQTISLFNSEGIFLKILDVNGRSQTAIDIKAINPGVLFVKIKLRNGNQITKKLVKLK